MEKNIEELTLLLMYLTAWDDNGYIEDEIGNIKETKIKNCWKGYDFDVLNKLTEKGLLYPAKYKNKSVTITKDGEIIAKKLVEKYLR